MTLAVRKRRTGRHVPPDLSDLMNTLVTQAHSFITAFDHRQTRLRQTVGDIQRIVDQIGNMQKTTSMFTRGGDVSAGLGLLMCLAGLSAAPFSFGVSTSAIVVGGIIAAFGRAVGLTATVTKSVKESNGAKRVGKLGESFMQMVEPLKSERENIKKTCAKLEEESTGIPADCVLTDLEELENILSELRRPSRTVSPVILAVIQEINTTLRIIANFFRVTGRPEEDKCLTDIIINSGRCCQKVIYELDVMKKNLKTFVERGGAISVGVSQSMKELDDT